MNEWDELMKGLNEMKQWDWLRWMRDMKAWDEWIWWMNEKNDEINKWDERIR